MAPSTCTALAPDHPTSTERSSRPDAPPTAGGAPPIDDRDDHRRRVDALLLRVGAGDAAAFADLHDLTSTRLWAVCRRVVRDPVEAEDVVQEAYLEIWRKAAGFDPSRGAGPAWMTAIAHHRSVDRVRSSEGARRRDTAWTRSAYRSPGDDTPERILAAVEVEEIRDAIGGLSDVRRQAVLYAFWSDHSYAQASVLLGIPLGTFKSRVRDAVLALRATLPQAG